MNKPKILISVLNWNSSETTLVCVASILKNISSPFFDTELVVIDNGSSEEDWLCLKIGCEKSGLRIMRQLQNLGFAGGHNISIRHAIEENFDYIWLVNSDAVIRDNALTSMLKIVESDPKCGAISPLILSLEDNNVIDFCGARHDWERLESVTCNSVGDAIAMEAKYPNDMWLMGAAIMLRTVALRQVGLLDDTLFAYYEDNDICARLSKAGWWCRMDFGATVLHAHPESRLRDKKPYYFYLMARNSFRFWYKHSPKKQGLRLRWKLVDREILVANRLHKLKLKDKEYASLLGIYDAQIGKMGEWDLSRKPPLVIRFLRWMLAANHRQHLRL